MPAILRTEDQRHRPTTDNDAVGRYAVLCIRRGYRWFPDEATRCQGFVASALRKGGFKVTWEVPIARADGRPGRIDLVAEYRNERVAIEIDYRSPREKSLDKLRQFRGYRIVCLRGVYVNPPDGIDAVVALPMRAGWQPPPARLRRDPAAISRAGGRLGPFSSIWQFMRRRPKWLLIAAALGALFFARPDVPSNLSGVGFSQIGPMALEILKAAGGQRLAVQGQSSTLGGPVRVIDGDTIVLTDTNTHIRLNGVDAPEVVHPGYDHDDDFGPESREEMRRIIGDRAVRCELNGERSHERLVGVCFLADGTDIGAEIIRRGLALDCAHYSGGRYRRLEPAGVREIIRQAKYC